MPRKPTPYPTSPLTNEDVENRKLLKEMNSELLGERIRLARQEMRVTQRGLSKNLFTSAYLSSMELGKTRPTLSNLQQIAERVNKSVAYFLRPPTLGFGGNLQGWQQEEGRLLQLRTGLIQVSVAISKRDSAEAANLLDQVKPYLKRLPDLDQATYHLWQASVFNIQGNSENSTLELKEGATLLERAGQAANPELLARFDLETGITALNKQQFVDALDNFRSGFKRVGLTDLTLKRRLQILISQCQLGLKHPEEAATTLKSFLQPEYNQRWAETAEINYKKAQSLDLQYSAFSLGFSEQIWAEAADLSILSKHYLDYTRLLFQSHQYSEGVKAAEVAYLLFQPNNYCIKLEILSLLGLMNSRLKDFKKARDWLDLAQLTLETNTCNESFVKDRYYQAAGEITSAKGQPEAATTFYHEALEHLDTSDEKETDARISQELRNEIYFELSQTFRQLGRIEEALNYIEKAVASNKTNKGRR